MNAANFADMPNKSILCAAIRSIMHGVFAAPHALLAGYRDNQRSGKDCPRDIHTPRRHWDRDSLRAAPLRRARSRAYNKRIVMPAPPPTLAESDEAHHRHSVLPES